MSSGGGRIEAPKGTRDAADVGLRPRDGLQPDRARRRRRRCSTSTPAPGRSGSRRSRAAPSAASSSTARATPAARSARTSRSSGCRATVLCMDAERALANERGPYDLILADPPYDFDAYERLAPHFARLLAPDGLAVVQTPAAARAAPRGPQHPYLPPLRLRAPYAVRAVITAICPGSYDPVTNGHVDVIGRARPDLRPRRRRRRRAIRSTRTTLLPIEERVDLVREALVAISATSRSTSSRSSSSSSRAAGTRSVIVKGLRVISDFEWEFQMNQLNRTLAPGDRDGVRDGEPAGQLRVARAASRRSPPSAAMSSELVPPAVARRLKELFPNGRGGAPLNAQE